MALVSADRRMRVRFRTLAASAVVLSVAVAGCTRVGDVEESKVSTDDPAQEISRPDRDSTTTTASESGPEVSAPTTTTPVIPETTVATVLGESTVVESSTTSQPGVVLSTIAPTTAAPSTAAPTTAGTLARPEQQSGSATQTTVATGAGTTATTSGVQVATTATSAVRAGDAGAETTTSAVSTTQTGAAGGTATTDTSDASDTATTTAGTSSATTGDSGAGTATATTETAVETTTTAAPETTTTTAAPTTTTVAGTYDELVEVAPNGAPIVASSAGDVAQQLLLAETGIRAGQDFERNAHLQQVIYRRIARNPQWDQTILDAMPESYRSSVSRNIEARRSFLSVASYPKVIPQWRVVEPVEGNTLLGYFQEAQDAYGIPWTYLAAMNLVESGMGRIVPYPTFPVGPRGPMQFRPETWERYGEGGDITDQRDSIMAAARMLADNDFNVDTAKALFAYNPKDAYVTGVTAYARTMTEEPNTFWGYYYWEVYYLANGGDLWLDEGYNHRYASQVDAYRESNPQAN